MDTEKRLQAEIDSLKTKLENSQVARERDNRAFKDTLNQALDKLTKQMESKYTSFIEGINEEHTNNIKNIEQGHKDKIKALKEQHKAEVEKALTNSTLVVRVAELENKLTQVENTAERRRVALYDLRKILTDADNTVSAVIKE